MQLTCSLCPQTFRSLVINKDQALIECVEKLVAHVGENHSQHIQLYNQKLQQIMSSVAGRMIFIMFVNRKAIDEHDARDLFIVENFEKSEQEILTLLGVEFEDDTGEEEEEPENEIKKETESIVEKESI